VALAGASREHFCEFVILTQAATKQRADRVNLAGKVEGMNFDSVLKQVQRIRRIGRADLASPRYQ
jgi:hypothetical protein